MDICDPTGIRKRTIKIDVPDLLTGKVMDEVIFIGTKKVPDIINADHKSRRLYE